MKKLPLAPPAPRYAAYVRDRSTTNWENYIRALDAAGRAVRVANVIVDGESIFRRRFACDTRTCAPTRNPRTGRTFRDEGSRSCCADLVVDLAPLEVEGLERHWEPVRAFLASKDRFFEGKAARDCVELSSDYEVSLKKRAGRCIFALRDAEWGIRCGIHSACLEKGLPLREVKPVVCDTFPLLIMDLPGDRFYVGAHDEDCNAIASLGEDPVTAYPCLAHPRKGKPMYLEMEATLRAYLGDPAFEAMAEAAPRYLAGPRPRALRAP